MSPSNLALQLGSAIRSRRNILGLSQDAFADLINMHRAYFSAIERGEKNVTVETLARVTRGLGVTMTELFRDARL